MTEALAVLARSGGVAALAYLLGSVLLLALAGSSSSAAAEHLQVWRRQLLRWFPLAAGVRVATDLLALLAQAARIADASLLKTLRSGSDLVDLAVQTHYGQVWMAGTALSLCMLVLTVGAARWPAFRGARGYLAAVAALALARMGVAAMTSHAGTVEGSAWLLPVQVLHVLALSSWAGALPGWVLLVRHAQRQPGGALAAQAAHVVQRFSRAATFSVVLILVSGTVLALEFITNEGEWLGTVYGGLVSAKLLLLGTALLFALGLRRRYLPLLPPRAGAADHAWAARKAALEMACVGAILILGGWLAITTPALHDTALWWLPRRLSWDATWPVWPTPLYATAALALPLVVGGWVLARGALKTTQGRAALAASTALGLLGLAWTLSVPAYPDSFKRSTSAYLTASVAQGRQLFEQHCVSCHGPGGLGDGVLAKKSPRPPANLSEPHTALHTAGDMYWWLSHGIPAGAMPGFADQIDEQGRWDIVNFLRAFSQGFQARILSSTIVPEQPWLAAPNFYIEPPIGAAHQLKDYRQQADVLLVFYSSEAASLARVQALAGQVDALRAGGIQPLFIAIDAVPGWAQWLPQVVEGAAQTWQTYNLLTRSVTDRGERTRIDLDRSHAEFLVDRHGYLRARWLAGDSASGWPTPADLFQQRRALDAERLIPPPPDDHLH
jgi:copper resistance protein D